MPVKIYSIKNMTIRARIDTVRARFYFFRLDSVYNMDSANTSDDRAA